MNEPIMPREKGRYACWIKGHQRECDAHSYAWANHRASARHAALSFAEDLADHGRHPELVGKPLEVMVRDKVDGSLSEVSIGWEAEPMPFIAGEEQVEAQRGEVAHA